MQKLCEPRKTTLTCKVTSSEAMTLRRAAQRMGVTISTLISGYCRQHLAINTEEV